MKITVLVAPLSPSPQATTTISPRKFDAVDEFAKALGDAAGVPVSVVKGPLSAAPGDGYLILFDSADLDKGPSAASRAILINADRASVLTRLERDNLVGAVEKQRYFQWRTQRSSERPTGLFGRKDVVAQMGGALAPGPFQSARYGLMSNPAYRDLPSLIAGYLRAHSKALA